MDINTQKPLKVATKPRKYQPSWADKFPWVRCIIRDSKEYMKCEYCEKYKMHGPWGIGDGCVTMQRDAIVDHALTNVHKLASSKWLCEVEKKAKSMRC